MKYLIAGLGNIGDEYANTRHNIGFDILDFIAHQKETNFTTDRLADIAGFKHRGRQFHLIKPSTYMNHSGRAVKYWLDKLSIPVENLLVVVDEIALPVGKLRVKPKGSDGGHNGLKSINLHLGTQDYPRLRVGVGNDYPKGQQVRYVLGRWTDEQWEVMAPKIESAADLILDFGSIGLQQTMNQYNNL